MLKQLYISLSVLTLFSFISCSQKQENTPTETPPAINTNGSVNSGTKEGADKRPASNSNNSNTNGVPSNFVPKAPGKRISSVHVPGNYVAITFDDGPSSANTPRILNILARHNAKATFFVLGQNVERLPGIAQRASAAGHEIAVHGWDHKSLTSISRDSVCSQMTRSINAITKATGKRPRLMRPPYGAVNSSLVDLFYSRFGLATIMWSIDTNDWRKPGVQTVINRAVNGAKPGSIILLHDIHTSTANAVEGIVKGLKARGFQLVTVSELIRRSGSGASTPAPAAAATSTEPAAAEVLEESADTPATEELSAGEEGEEGVAI